MPIAQGYKVDYDRATDQTDLCAWQYPGAAGKCQAEAVGVAFSEQLGEIPFCERHMEEGTR